MAEKAKQVRSLTIKDVENGFIVEVEYKRPKRKDTSKAEMAEPEPWEEYHKEYVFSTEDEVGDFVRKVFNL